MSWNVDLHVLQMHSSSRYPLDPFKMYVFVCVTGTDLYVLRYASYQLWLGWSRERKVYVMRQSLVMREDKEDKSSDRVGLARSLPCLTYPAKPVYLMSPETPAAALCDCWLRTNVLLSVNLYNSIPEPTLFSPLIHNRFTVLLDIGSVHRAALGPSLEPFMALFSPRRRPQDEMYWFMSSNIPL